MTPGAQRTASDEGAITVLIIGYVAIAIALIIVGIDASKVFLAQRALSSAADSAALAAAQGVDRGALYDGRSLGCGSRLPLDPNRADDLAAGSLDDDATGLEHDFGALDPAQTSLAGPTATVQLSGSVDVPFGRVLSWLDPSSGGHVHVTETSHAQSPVVSAAGC